MSTYFFVIIKVNSRDDVLKYVKTIVHLAWIPSDSSAVSLRGLEANHKVTAGNRKITARQPPTIENI